MLFFERLRLLLPWIRAERERSLEEELRFHQEMAQPGGINTVRVKEEAREAWTFGALERAAQDLRYTLRSLGRAKSFTAVAVMSLGLGCASATAIFSLVNAIVLKPLGYRNSGELVFVRQIARALQHLYPTLPVNMQHFLYWRSHARTFESLAVFKASKMTLTERGDPESIDMVMASSNLFHVLGIDPVLGRAFQDGEDQPGRNSVVVITDTLYRRRFGGAPGTLNSKILLDGKPYVVVGILPPGFHFLHSDDLGSLAQLGKNPEIFCPMGKVLEGWNGDFDNSVIGRLAAGISPKQGLGELNVFEQQIGVAHPESRDVLATGTILQEQVAAPARASLYVLLSAVLVLVLIVCVNLAHLMFARVNVRSREFSIRAALGAGRSRIVRQVLNETLVLGLFGGTLGLFGAGAILHWFIASAPAGIPRIDEVRIDWRVLLFSFVLSLVCGLLSGAIPAMRIARLDPQEALKSAAHTSTGSRRDLRLREFLVAAEVALSAILLVCAGLFIGSLRNVLRIDRGFAVQKAITFGIQLPEVHYRQVPDRVQFYDRALTSLGSIPGVDSAAYVLRLPLTGESNVNAIKLEGSTRNVTDPTSKDTILVNVRDVSSDYFRAMGIPLVKGRVFDQHDRNHAVALVSSRLAAKLWPDQDPLGHSFSTGSGVGTVEVAGVVQDVHNAKLEKDPTLMVYVPYWARPRFYGDIIVRTAIDPIALMPEVRRRIWSIDSSIPVGQMRTIDDLISDATAQRRLQMEVVAGFASAALILAVIGIYGVVAYNAAQRRFEMGLRAALGARPGQILGLMTASGLRPIACGLLAGLAGAAFCGRLIRALLYGVSPVDGTVMVLVALMLSTVGALACILPGRSVTRVDPATVLRYE